MVARGETVGLFQVESAGMRRALLDMRRTASRTLSPLGALYRPGPMANIPTYCARKHGTERPTTSIRSSSRSCAKPSGSSSTRSSAPDCSGAVRLFARPGRPSAPRHGKKIKEGDGSAARRFRLRSGRARVDHSQAEAIFELLARFADYRLNKSHAAAYALVTYQTAYLKAHYPVEFLAASMTLSMGNTDKLGGIPRRGCPPRHHVEPPVDQPVGR